MKIFKKLILTLILFALPLQVFAGKISGSVINGETKQPMKPDMIILFEIVQGLAEKERIEKPNSDGTFEFSSEIDDNFKIYLVKAFYKGVDYNQRVQIDRDFNGKVEIEIFEPTTDLRNITYTLLHRIVRPVALVGNSANEFLIESTYTIENKGNTVFNLDEEVGTFHFYAPENVVDVPSVSSKYPGTKIASPENVFDGDNDNEYFISFPFKPGKSELVVTFNLPYTEREIAIEEPLYHDFDKFNIFIAPTSLEVETDSTKLENKGVIGQIQFYHLKGIDLKKGDKISYKWSGGDFSEVAHSEDDGHNHQQELDIKSVPSILPESKLGIILLGFAVFFMVTGFGMNRVSKNRILEKEEFLKAQKLKEEKEDLVKQIARLDDKFAAGNLNQKKYSEHRKELMGKVKNVFEELKKFI